MEEGNRASVNRIKKMIIATICILIFVPIILCIVLMIRIGRLEKKFDEYLKNNSQSEVEVATENDAALAEARIWQTTEVADVPSPKQQMAKEDADAINDLDKQVDDSSELLLKTKATDTDAVYNGHKVYLTFDDGPGPYTNEILDILKEKGVKATFFVVADDFTYADEMNRIVAEGHTLAMHSMSHKYDVIYKDIDSFKQDVNGLHDLLYYMTGVDCKYYRFPGGSSNTVADVSIDECIDFLNESGITYFDWNALNGDAEYVDYTADELNTNVMGYVHNNPGNSTVLLHDLGNHYATVEALPGLIDTLKSEGYEILPIDDTTKPVQHKAEESTEE